MREFCTYGSVGEASGNRCLYPEEQNYRQVTKNTFKVTKIVPRYQIPGKSNVQKGAAKLVTLNECFVTMAPIFWQ